MRVHQGGYVALSNHLKEFFSKSIFPQGLQNIPVAGKLLFSHSLFFYLALVLAVVMWWFLYKTRTGLHLRSVGENPATADAAGINVTKFKYLSTIIGGGISAIGGMVYIVTTAGCVWNHEGLSGRRLAGRRTGHLLHVASAVGDLGFDLLRRADDPVSPPDHPLYPDPAL